MWRAGKVVSLAEDIYNSRDFSGISFLADELQEAGCTNTKVLQHCRSEGPHVKGCWVVDLILNKR